MTSPNPYRAIAAEYDRLLHFRSDLAPCGPVPPPLAADAPKVLLFSPHPDDESLTGGLPLRLRRELQFDVINVAVTLGSNPERQGERWQELQNACQLLGFGLIGAAEGGLASINPAARQNRSRWCEAVALLVEILHEHRPQIIFCPHEGDRHPTHIGTHYLAIDALQQCGPDFGCWVVETEFWGAMASPNLLVESSCEDVADLMAATACHVGEVRRNPYHLRLPAWMADNVRRGGELVGGAGAVVPDFSFATLYRRRRWAGGTWGEESTGGEIWSVREALRSRFD